MSPHPQNRDEWVHRAFDERARARIRALATPELIAEHARAPNGMHSDALQRVLAYFRRGPIAGKYVIVAERPFERYRIGILSGERGTPVAVLEGAYPTVEETEHAIFLRRLADIGATP